MQEVGEGEQSGRPEAVHEMAILVGIQSAYTWWLGSEKELQD